jgi:hypothetical protein
MRIIDKATKVSRRSFLKTSSLTAFGSVALGSGAMLLDPKGAWAMTLKSLQPQTMATLILMARDIYPHDRLTDAVYAKAVSGYDDQSASDPDTKTMIETGTGQLDKAAQAAYKVDYVNIGWEEQRTHLLRGMQETAFFQTIRAGLVTSLYNQHDIWMKFGYEGASADKGGYIHRGFNDINWLPAQPAQEVQS